MLTIPVSSAMLVLRATELLGERFKTDAIVTRVMMIPGPIHLNHSHGLVGCVCVCVYFSEKEHSVLRKVLLEDEVLAAMVSVIGTATTHLSPE